MSSLTPLSLTHHTFYHQILRAIPSKYIPTPNIFTTSVAMTLSQATFTSCLDYQTVSSSSLCLYQFSTQQLQSFYKNIFLGFPWWSSGLESAFQCRGLKLSSTKFPHIVGQLQGNSAANSSWRSPRAATTACRANALQQTPCSAT